MIKKFKKNSVIDIEITDISPEGYGSTILTCEDETTLCILVPFSFPGDRVKVSLFKKKNKIMGHILELLYPSNKRITAKCEHFTQCGGCQWQHITYQKQLELKQKLVIHCLSDSWRKETTLFPIIPSDLPWKYRNKAEFTFSTDKAMNRYLGFILYNSRGKVFNLSSCQLIPDWMNQIVHAVKEWWIISNLDAYHAMKDRGSLRTLTLREGKRTNDKMVILTVSGNANFALNSQQLKSFTATIKTSLPKESQMGQLSIFLRIQQIAKGKKTQFYEMQLDGPDHIIETMQNQNLSENNFLKFRISPPAFFQPNTTQAEKLYHRVVEMAAINKESVVYDLYCGTGTLGIFLAKYVKKVYGIELSADACLDAKENIKQNELNNITIYQGDVAVVLPSLIQEEEHPDLVIVDPPRAGLDRKALSYLISLAALKVIYVSCNPVTQGNDLKELAQAGYQLAASQAIDQFPHTVHVENIILLTYSKQNEI